MEEDFDESAENNDIQAKLKNHIKIRKSVSLFDLVIEAVPADKMKKTEYEESLLNEAKDWNNLLKEKIHDVEKEEKEKRKIDKSILTDAQINYLEQMPNLGRFAKESDEFCMKARSYLHANAEVVEMHEELAKYCRDPLEQVATDIIYECIYMHRTNSP